MSTSMAPDAGDAPPGRRGSPGLDAAQLSRLSQLWDQAAERPESQWPAWFVSLDGEDPAVLGALWSALGRGHTDEGGDEGTLAPLRVLGDDEADGSPFQIGGIVGPYRLVRLIGRGGSATVWQAERHDGMLQRPVALKLPRRWDGSDGARARVEHERDILARLTHPHIARLYDAGVSESGMPYLALEFVDGMPLTDYATRLWLDVPARLGLFIDALEAVAFAHARNIVHCDLKPSNILVSRDGQVHLLDFGVAALTQAEETATLPASVALTPGYASPEQLAGGRAREASDIYSLGVVLYELLTGERPYQLKAGDRRSFEQVVSEAEIVQPSLAVRTLASAGQQDARRCAAMLRGDLDAVVMAAMHPEPSQRYRSVEAFATDLRRFLAGEPVTVRPGWRHRFRFKLRRQSLAALAVLGGVMLLGAALWSTATALREARLHQERAVESAKSGEQLERFFEGLFRRAVVASPNAKGERLLDARELLDAGRREIDQSLEDRLALKLRLQRMLANLYRGLRADEDAEQLARSNLELARRFPETERDVVVVQSAFDLLPILIDWGRKQDVEQSFAEVEAAIGRLGELARDPAQVRLFQGRLRTLRATYLETRDPGAGVLQADTAVRLLDGFGDHPWRTDALLTRSSYYISEGKERQANLLLTRAMDSMRPGDDLYTLAAQMRCAARSNVGEIDSAIDDCRQALELVRRHSGASSLDAANAAVNLGVTMLRYKRYAEARSVLLVQVQDLMSSQEPGAQRFLASLYGHLALAAVQTGDLTEAEQWLDRQKALKLDLAETLTGSLSFVWQLPTAELALLSDRVAEVDRALDAGFEELSRIGAVRGMKRQRLLTLQARRALSQGDPRAAYDGLNAAEPRSSDTSVPLPERLDAELVSIDALLALGRRTEAGMRLDALRSEVAEAPRPVGLAHWAAAAQRVQARLDLMRGDAASAYGQLVAAERYFAEVETADGPEAVRWRCWRAAAAAASGRLDEARQLADDVDAWRRKYPVYAGTAVQRQAYAELTARLEATRAASREHRRGD